MRYFPLFFDTKAKRLLIVGGGEVAARKLALWRRTEMTITLVSPQLCAELRSQQDGFHWVSRHFDDDLIPGFDGVIAATDDEGLNRRISVLAKEQGAWVNVVDDPGACTVITPAIVDRSPVVVAIGSEGGAPVLVKELRRRLESLLPSSLSPLARFMSEARYRIPLANRRRVWERFLGSNGLAYDQQTETRLEQAMEQQAGTGWALLLSAEVDSELLPLKAAMLMQECDALWFDGVLPGRLDELCRRDAQRLACLPAALEPGQKVLVVASSERYQDWQRQLSGVRVIEVGAGWLA
ncbi:precorrin-2 dehydrogenase / sirohydrochlorin ferrochelatase [Ferrimonas sediminum]|uniref:precorrin-2 dehydrogenase n=1 Tax=Ferrimonas sediminum TaxID=718193 RepID=A0A1G8QDC7_9GAMM|nr:bifunctional precorrin-2 dehydrogenase/sirohydrochlorin ferrochelatase [Ferrimonas sediminum]SDJ02638.1 precorrin-2 dehydrogenase / sirohydrochlorin ferrochelatase [Ferrimonas sediminum]